MESRRLSLPHYRDYEYGFQSAYEVVCEKLGNIQDIEQLCLQSGVQCQIIDSKKVITLEYLNKTYQVALPDIEISLVDSEAEEVPLRDKVLILHYLTQAKGTPSTQKLIAYKELPGGANYFPTFSKRAIKPLLSNFGPEPQQLIYAAKKLGGYKVDYGDAAVTINAFAHVPITFVLWRGDEEFAPGGNILFDSNVSDYMTTEDINVLCQTIAWKLVQLSKQI